MDGWMDGWIDRYIYIHTDIWVYPVFSDLACFAGI